EGSAVTSTDAWVASQSGGIWRLRLSDGALLSTIDTPGEQPNGVALGPDGSLYIASIINPYIGVGRVRRVDLGTLVQTIISTGSFLQFPNRLLVMANGDAFVADGVAGRVIRILGNAARNVI